jgi:hypothetical protein
LFGGLALFGQGLESLGEQGYKKKQNNNKNHMSSKMHVTDLFL